MTYKPPILAYVALILALGPSVLLGAKPLSKDSLFNQVGGNTLLDGSLQASGSLQANDHFEIVGVSTPSTPVPNHSKLWLNNTTGSICAIFDSGSTTCMAGSSGGGAGTITGVTAGSGLIGGGTSGAVTLSLISPLSNSFLNPDVVLNDSAATFVSSVTVTAAGGESATYGLSAGSVTVTGLTASQYVKTNSSKQLASQSGVPTSDLTGTLASTQFPALTGDITTSAGALATTAATTQSNIKVFTSSISVLNANGLLVTYQVNAGSFTGAGLSTCGDSTHALAWSSTSNTFSCQAVTGSASAGGSTKQIQYNNAGALGGFPSAVTSSSVTISTPTLVMGTITNDNAPVGYYGEYVSSTSVASQASPTSTNFGDLLSMSLTPGDWEISVIVFYDKAASVTDVRCGASTTSGNSSTGLTTGDNFAALPPVTSTAGQTCVMPAWRKSLSATTTVYLKYFAQYSGTSPQANGRISARRMR